MRLTRHRLVLVALCALVVVVVGWALFRSQSPHADTTSTGMRACPLATLPSEAADTVGLIHSAGPFPYPRNDGVVFGNREGHLPDQSKGYYHEYTVITPGAQNRATRRIVTGGTPRTDPPEYFYTGDHYDSFCLVPDAGRR